MRRKLKIFDVIKENIGKTYCYLTIIDINGNTASGSVGVKCLCKCGSINTYAATNIFSGKRISCGCYKQDKNREIHKYKRPKHRRSHPDYALFCTMKRRCKAPNATQYKNYGARGIKVCSRWDNNYDGFENFINDLGPRPSKKYSLDRIDVNGNYEPSNCRWATQKEQTNNRRGNVIIIYNGIKKPVLDWAKEFNLPAYVIYHRAKNNWPVEKLFVPLLRVRKNKKDEKTNNTDNTNNKSTEL